MPITFHRLTESGMLQLDSSSSSVFQLFTPEFLNSHPYKDQKNIFYTAGSVSLKNRATMIEQEILPFDIDGISASENKDHYRHIFSQFMGIGIDDFITVDTGHGLHLLVGLSIPYKDPSVFTIHRKYYNYTCDNLNVQFYKANLVGRLDRSVFKASQLLRLPGTINHKPKRYAEDSVCVFLGGRPVLHNIDLKRLSGVEEHEVPANHQLAKAMPPADLTAVFAGCDYIKMCKSGVSLSEPQWYGMLGILSKCRDGRKAAHEISSIDRTKYDREDTDRKFDQADDASNGRLCTSIMGLWGGCSACPSFNRVTTPLMLRGRDYIATEHTNFHMESTEGKNKGKKVPVISDLVKYVVREGEYILFPRSTDVDIYRYTGKYWKEIELPRFRGHIVDMYRPETPSSSITSETVRRIIEQTPLMREGRPSDPCKYISLENGDFSIENLEILPHNRDHNSFSKLDFNYDPSASCPKFEKFLSEVFTSPVYAANSMEFFASAMFNLPNYIYDKCLILYGPKSNGKSTLANIMMKVLGRDNVSADTIEKESFSKIGGLVTVVTAKLNIAEEAEWSMFSSPQFKNIVSGGLVTINPKGKSMVTVKFNTKLMFCTNEIPKAHNSIDAISKRIMLCNMPNIFDDGDPRQNKNLVHEICASELPGIFNMLVVAGKRLMERGMYDTTTIEYQAMTKDFRVSANNVLNWANDVLVPSPEDSISVRELYEQYILYCTVNKQYIDNNIKFAKIMKSEYPGYGTDIRIGKRVIRSLKGYKIRMEEEFDDDGSI